MNVQLWVWLALVSGLIVGCGKADYVQRGAYRCCLEGQGDSCCDGDKSTCAEHGGSYGACRGQGEEYEGKVICAQCCEGLTAIGTERPGPDPTAKLGDLPAGCIDPAPPSIVLCAACGNGTCEAGENYCNCPADCPR